MKYTIFFILIFFLTMQNSYSIEIKETKGIFKHNNTIKIIGNGFGVKNISKPLKWETFEDGKYGDYVSATGYWSRRPISGATFNNTKNRHSESNFNVKVNFNPNENIDGWFYRNNIGFAKTGKAYVSFWVYCDFISGDDSWMLKLWRLNSDGNDHGSRPMAANTIFFNSPNPVSSYYDSTFLNHADGSGIASLKVPFSPVEGYWFNFSLAWKASSLNEANGEFYEWTSQTPSSNGVIKINKSVNFSSRSVSYPQDINAIALGYLIETGGIEAITYWDDIYMDNSWARIEIGDNISYDACSHREIQIPTSWSRVGNPDQFIEITVNQGSFVSGKDYYLFVVNEEGIPSIGHRIVFQ